MPFVSLVMGPRTHNDYSHSKVKAEVHDSKHNVQNFHTRLGGGITACSVTVIDYCTCALCFQSHLNRNDGYYEGSSLKMVIKQLMY